MWYRSDLYGNYRTRTFTDIFPDYDTFQDEYDATAFEGMITDANCEILYYLLYARYGNSSIASSDEERFKYSLFALIFQYGPAWEKKLALQQTLRGLTQDQLLQGSRLINNHVANPGDTASSTSLTELTGVDDQNQTLYKKGILEGYNLLIELLEDDVTEYFIRKFQKLFLQFVNPEVPLWYVSEGDGT